MNMKPMGLAATLVAVTAATALADPSQHANHRETAWVGGKEVNAFYDIGGEPARAGSVLIRLVAPQDADRPQDPGFEGFAGAGTPQRPARDAPSQKPSFLVTTASAAMPVVLCT